MGLQASNSTFYDVGGIKMNTSGSSGIQVWQMYQKTPVRENVEDTAFRIRIDGDAPALPAELEEEVQSNWQKQLEKNPLAKENRVLFLSEEPRVKQGVHEVATNIRGFSNIAFFNRNFQSAYRVEDIAENKLLHLSTHGHILVKGQDGNDKIVYGIKANQFQQRSGFLGFPNAEKESIYVDGVRYLDLHKSIMNRANELQQFKDTISSIDVIGMTYVGTLEKLNKQRKLLRGVDTNFLLTLEGVTAEEMANAFEESPQFKKGLHITDADPKSQSEFFKGIFATGHEMSPYAMGCAIARTNALYGPKGAQQLAETVRELGYHVELEKRTNLI